MAEQFKWVSFYMEFATRLLEYKTDRGSLIEKLQKVYSDIGMKLPKLEKDNIPKDIDPFTIFGLFNKGITDANRVSILGLHLKLPSNWRREILKRAELHLFQPMIRLSLSLLFGGILRWGCTGSAHTLSSILIPETENL